MSQPCRWPQSGECGFAASVGTGLRAEQLGSLASCNPCRLQGTLQPPHILLQNSTHSENSDLCRALPSLSLRKPVWGSKMSPSMKARASETLHEKNRWDSGPRTTALEALMFLQQRVLSAGEKQAVSKACSDLLCPHRP